MYLVHRLDPFARLEETLSALQSLVVAGEFRYLGFSNWPAWLAAKAVGIRRANGWEPFRTAESYNSLLGRDLKPEIIPFTLDHGIGMQVWSPLSGGFRSGRFTHADLGGRNDRLTGFDLVSFDCDRGHHLVGQLRAVAAKRGQEPAQIALASLLRSPGVTIGLLGASRQDQLAGNLGAVDAMLSDNDLMELEPPS